MVTSAPRGCSAYGAIEGDDAGALHLILLNKEAVELTFRIHVTGRSYGSGQVWGFDASSPRITARDGVASIAGDTFDYTITLLSAVHLLLR